jgi:acyl-CoA synthetase (AMP-forming)/AMP-acid ligase II
MRSIKEKIMENEYVLKELCRYSIGTYADIVYRNAILFADEVAFVYGEERVTFAQFNSRVNGLIHGLSNLGVNKGDVLGILSWNCLEYIDVFGAAMKGGFVASPFNPRLQKDELEYLINYSGATALFVGPELVPVIDSLKGKLRKVKHLISLEGVAEGMTPHRTILEDYSSEEPDIQVDEGDPLLIIYTSGTTGVPKGALYTHRRKLEDTRLFTYGLAIENGNKEFMSIPLFHIAGISYLLAFFYGGGVNILSTHRTFDPSEALKTIQDEEVTDIHIVPTNLVSMLAMKNIEEYDLTSLKRIWYAGSPMPVEVLKKGMDLFGPIFIQAYGQSESGPLTTVLSQTAHNVLDKPQEAQKVLASCGQPVPGVHVRIVDVEDEDVKLGEVGEILIRSRSIMQEYWLKHEETAQTLADGWLHTGDMGFYDTKGNIYLVDRKKDMIITGGENVYPREVEEVLYRHPAIEEAAVIGLPDAYWVERVHAVVTLKAGTSVDASELIAFCKEHLARYKAPKSVDIVNSLPKSPQGKILKRVIKEDCREKAKK